MELIEQQLLRVRKDKTQNKDIIVETERENNLQHSSLLEDKNGVLQSQGQSV